MLSVLLASVLVQQTAPEPKLEWSTFGEFAAKQFEGSEYRLVMDRAIGERPMVYYFSNPGTDKLALLKRTCKELCLNFDVDEKFKKVFISGPNSDAGLTLKGKLQIGLQRVHDVVRANWRKTNGELETAGKALLDAKSKATTDDERNLLDFDYMVLVSLQRPDSRAVLACVLSVDAATLASRIAGNPTGEGAIGVSQEAARVLEQEYNHNPPQNEGEAIYWNAMRKVYQEMVADSGALSFTHSVSKTGAASFFISMVGRTKSNVVGAFSMNPPNWIKSGIRDDVDQVPESLANEEFNPKQAIFWGVDGMNVFQTLAIKHKWNTVAWLDTGRIQPDFSKTIRGFSQLKKMRVKLTNDGWMVPYIQDQRWPEFSGNWRGIIKMTGKIEPETDIKLLREYLESLTSEEIDGMAGIKGETFDYRLEGLISTARIVRAALRISAESKQKEFELKLSQLNLEQGAEISQYWPHSRNIEMKAPMVVQRRGHAILLMLDREVPDPDFEDMPASRTLVVILAVPNGTEGANGNRMYAVDRCEVILKKET